MLKSLIYFEKSNIWTCPPFSICVLCCLTEVANYASTTRIEWIRSHLFKLLNFEGMNKLLLCLSGLDSWVTICLSEMSEP